MSNRDRRILIGAAVACVLIITVAVVAGLSMRGNGGSEAATPPPQAAATQPGSSAEAAPQPAEGQDLGGAASAQKYAGEQDGAALVVTLPASPNWDAKIAEIEAFRQKLKIPDTYTYLSQTMDNGGTTEVATCPPRVVTPDGATVTSDFARFVVSGWFVDQGVKDTDLYNEGVALTDSLSTGSALPGSTTDALFMAEGNPSVQTMFSGVRRAIVDPCDLPMEPVN